MTELIQRVPTSRVTVNGHSIVYLDRGAGPPLVLIHGLGGAMWHWEHQQTALARQYRVITLDLLGSGRSDKPDIAYDAQRLLHFFVSFLDHLQIQRATLIGSSMGAGIAMATAITQPDRVAALVLISGLHPRVRETVSLPSLKRLIHHRPPLWMAELGNRFTGRWATRRTLQEIVYDHTLLTPSVIERSYHNRKQENVLGPIYSLLDHLDEWRSGYSRRMSEITQPTLLIWGTQDRIFLPAVGRELAAMLPHAAFELVAEAGHLPQWEQPDPVNAHILNFLDQHIK